MKVRIDIICEKNFNSFQMDNTLEIFDDCKIVREFNETDRPAFAHLLFAVKG